VKLAESVGMPAWVQVDAAKLEGVFKKVPDRDEFGADIKEVADRRVVLALKLAGRR
jgi:small subunit ribosomal protein S4